MISCKTAKKVVHMDGVKARKGADVKKSNRLLSVCLRLKTSSAMTTTWTG